MASWLAKQLVAYLATVKEIEQVYLMVKLQVVMLVD